MWIWIAHTHREHFRQFQSFSLCVLLNRLALIIRITGKSGLCNMYTVSTLAHTSGINKMVNAVKFAQNHHPKNVLNKTTKLERRRWLRRRQHSRSHHLLSTRSFWVSNGLFDLLSQFLSSACVQIICLSFGLSVYCCTMATQHQLLWSEVAVAVAVAARSAQGSESLETCKIVNAITNTFLETVKCTVAWMEHGSKWNKVLCVYYPLVVVQVRVPYYMSPLDFNGFSKCSFSLPALPVHVWVFCKSDTSQPAPLLIRVFLVPLQWIKSGSVPTILSFVVRWQ